MNIQLFAQEPLMAKGNKTLTVSYGASNIYRSLLNLYLSDQQINNSSSGTFTSSAKFSNPLVATFDYALSDYTTIGLSVSYYSFHLHEQKNDVSDTLVVDSKGFKSALQLRGVRYLIQKPRSIFYFFAGAGIRFRSVKYNTSDEYAIQSVHIHQIPETNPSSYSPLSLDVGMGLKFLITRRIGLSAEFGMMTGIAQVGLFYSFKNKWRRSNDNIGW